MSSRKRKADQAAAGLFAKTTPAQDQAGSDKPKHDKTRNIGVGLKESELSELGERAQAMGVSRNALIVWLIRYGLAGLREESINPEFETVRQLKPPE